VKVSSSKARKINRAHPVIFPSIPRGWLLCIRPDAWIRILSLEMEDHNRIFLGRSPPENLRNESPSDLREIDYPDPKVSLANPLHSIREGLEYQGAPQARKPLRSTSCWEKT
jgi:hypothetical protein